MATLVRRPLGPLSAASVALALYCACLAPRETAFAQRPATRDWDRAPAIIEVDTGEDVFALGDVHGDYDRLLDVVKAGGIIAEAPDQPDNVRWSAGRAMLVCTGDLINKWDQSLKVLVLFRALCEQADRAGGRVIVMLGNHEVGFLTDPGDNKSSEFTTELRRAGLKPKDVAAGRDPAGIGAYLRDLPFGARVNDWFFIHAGNPAALTVPRLRAGFQRAVDWEGFRSRLLLAPDSPFEARLHPRPWWERDGDRPADAHARLQGAVRALGVRHLVVGHQPGAVEFCDGTKRKRGRCSRSTKA